LSYEIVDQMTGSTVSARSSFVLAFLRVD